MKNMTLLLIVFGLLFVSTAAAQAPGDTLWTQIYGGILSEHGHCVRQTDDGGYILVGLTSTFGPLAGNIWLMKTDEYGNSLWTRIYGGDREDIGFVVEPTPDGGYIIGGHTQSFGAGDSDMWLLKTDANGDTLWTKTYGGYTWEKCFSVQQTTDGGYILGGRTRSFGAGGYDFYVVKTDSLGNADWERTYGGTADDRGYCAIQTPDEGYLITGQTYSFGLGADIWLIKTDADGDTLWTRTYGGNNGEEGMTIQAIGDEGYIIFGTTYSYGAGSADFYMIRTDVNGDTLWTRTYGGYDAELFSEGQQTADGGYVLVGYTQTFGAGSKDIYLVRTDSNGDSLWTRAYGGWNYEFGNSVHQTDDGSFAVLGYTGSFTGNADWWFLKIAGETQVPDVSIEIVPDDPPVIVPPGGYFTYTGTLTNNTAQPQAVDAWIMVDVPYHGMYGPLRLFNNIPLSPHQIRSVPNIRQDVPEFAPIGLYTYIAYCGDYPTTVMDSSYFDVEVYGGIWDCEMEMLDF